MSRAYESEYDGDGPPPELYARNYEHHLRSSVGKRMLRELEAALLAVPEKRLILGALCRQGEVCAVGAYIVAKRVSRGEPRESVLRELDAHSRKFASYNPDDPYAEGDYEAAEDTVVEGKRVGLSKFLGWHISQFQDDDCATATPEERYERVLAEVRRLIAESETPIPDWAMSKKDRLAASNLALLSDRSPRL